MNLSSRLGQKNSLHVGIGNLRKDNIKPKLQKIAKKFKNIKNNIPKGGQELNDTNKKEVRELIKEFNDMKLNNDIGNNFTQIGRAVEADCLQSIFDVISDDKVIDCMVHNDSVLDVSTKNEKSLDDCITKLESFVDKARGPSIGSAMITRYLCTCGDSLVNSPSIILSGLKGLLGRGWETVENTTKQSSMGLGSNSTNQINKLKREIHGQHKDTGKYDRGKKIIVRDGGLRNKVAGIKNNNKEWARNVQETLVGLTKNKRHNPTPQNPSPISSNPNQRKI